MKKPKKKVLIIDDDPIMIRLATRMLENDGYQVFAAYGGNEGIQKATEEKPDLILLDVLMPDLDGKQVARRLSKHKDTKDIPIVFMTVTIKLEEDKGSENIAIDEIEYRGFAKPLHQRKILSVIRKSINRRLHGNT